MPYFIWLDSGQADIPQQTVDSPPTSSLDYGAKVDRLGLSQQISSNKAHAVTWQHTLCKKWAAQLLCPPLYQHVGYKLAKPESNLV